jgi:hypothetical protein
MLLSVLYTSVYLQRVQVTVLKRFDWTLNILVKKTARRPELVDLVGRVTALRAAEIQTVHRSFSFADS